MLIIKAERTDYMAVAMKEDYQRAMDEQKKEVRELVMAGLEQIKEGKTKELDEDEMLAGLGVRKDYYRNYKIYYVIEKDIVYIVRILHMLVDSKAWLYRTFGL